MKRAIDPRRAIVLTKATALADRLKISMGAVAKEAGLNGVDLSRAKRGKGSPQKWAKLEAWLVAHGETIPEASHPVEPAKEPASTASGPDDERPRASKEAVELAALIDDMKTIEDAMQVERKLSSLGVRGLLSGSRLKEIREAIGAFKRSMKQRREDQDRSALHALELLTPQEAEWLEERRAALVPRPLEPTEPAAPPEKPEEGP